MNDTEKVIAELEEMSVFFFDIYINEIGGYTYKKYCDAAENAIVMLKGLEPKNVLGIADSIEGMEVGKCPRCERTILNKQSDPTKYCKYCGQALKWNN